MVLHRYTDDFFRLEHLFNDAFCHWFTDVKYEVDVATATSLDGCGSRSAGQKFPKIVSRSSRLIRKNLRLILKKKTFYMLGHPADTRFTKFISQHSDLYVVLSADFFF